MFNSTRLPIYQGYFSFVLSLVTFLDLLFYFSFLSFTWFFFHFGSSSKYHHYNEKNLNGIIIVTIYIVLDVYVRTYMPTSGFYFFLLLFHYTNTHYYLKKNIWYTSLLWIFALPTCKSRTLAYNSLVNVPLVDNVAGGPL